jgi:hypothetical protein
METPRTKLSTRLRLTLKSALAREQLEKERLLAVLDRWVSAHACKLLEKEESAKHLELDLPKTQPKTLHTTTGP